ncbi:hypothetical protein HUW62_47045 [Myxococcus sp. AM011]|uniref:hypothetical protein n=1 Tax=Myxococcus sp. AM011 TaxID=2745200 RepID=UPI0015953235|nr:hypothetical protein [Myxococcus sp. AM011]NVJ28775.1 hypothetical protein [Myxococcus sp. AM011]
MRQKISPAQEFIQRLELLDLDEIVPPSSVEEADKILREAGVNPAEFSIRIRAHVQSVRQRLTRSQLAQSTTKRKEEESRLTALISRYADFSIEQLRAKVRALSIAPQNHQISVAHKGLSSSASREDLEALLTEFEHLGNEEHDVEK